MIKSIAKEEKALKAGLQGLRELFEKGVFNLGPADAIPSRCGLGDSPNQIPIAPDCSLPHSLVIFFVNEVGYYI